jgi:hypothetical protein
MRCFNHQDRESVGACKACGKGLCAYCAADLGHGLACKGVHEDDVDLQDSIIRFSARAIAAALRNAFLGPAFFTAAGALFIGFGCYEYGRKGAYFFFLLGGIFVPFGLTTFLRGRAIYTAK